MKWWKSHSDLYQTPEMIKLVNRFGFAGAGFYNFCKSQIAMDVSKENLTFELRYDVETLAIMGRAEETDCQAMLDYLVELGLLELRQGKITCMALIGEIENSIVKSPQIKDLQERLKKLKAEGRPDPGSEKASRDDPEPSGTVRDDPGQSGMVREEFGLDLDLDTTTPNYSIIPRAFKPSHLCLKLLEDDLVPPWFIDEYLREFRLFWSESGARKASWSMIFYRQCAEQWRLQRPSGDGGGYAARRQAEVNH